MDYRVYLLYPLLALIQRTVQANNEKLTWEEAEGKCRNESKDLYSDLDNHGVKDVGLTGDTWTVWTGATREDYSTPRWINGSDVDLTMLSYYNEGDKAPMCGYLHSRDNTLELQGCDVQHIGYLCQIPGCSRCPMGLYDYQCFSLDNNCYVNFCGIDNWYSARDTCTRRGWTLASIKSKSLVSGVAGKLYKSTDNKPCKTYWVGFRTADWIDENRTLVQMMWLPKEPNPAVDKKCMVIKHNATHTGCQAVSCNERHQVKCQDPNGSADTRSTVATTTAARPTTSAVHRVQTNNPATLIPGDKPSSCGADRETIDSMETTLQSLRSMVTFLVVVVVFLVLGLVALLVYRKREFLKDLLFPGGTSGDKKEGRPTEETQPNTQPATTVSMVGEQNCQATPNGLTKTGEENVGVDKD